MYYLETDEINAFFESITENIKKIYKNEPYVFSNFDQVKKHLPEGKILYIDIEFLQKYITLWRETKKFINEATLEDYSNIMAANSKVFAFLMMKFKYPNFKKTDPKFNAAMDREIQKGTLFKEYMESKAAYMKKKLQNLVSIVYDFCQRFRKEEYQMLVEVRMNENDYTRKFRLKANPVLLMQTYHILEYWIRKHATAYLMTPDELDSKHSESDFRTITNKLYSDIIRAYTYENRNILYELDEKAERFRMRINTLRVSNDNLGRLLELYFKHMKVDYDTLD